MFRWVWIGAGLALAACGVDTGPADSDGLEPMMDIDMPTGASIELVDPTIPPAVAGEQGWNYHQGVDIDLTGDGTLEQLPDRLRVLEASSIGSGRGVSVAVQFARDLDFEWRSFESAATVNRVTGRTGGP